MLKNSRKVQWLIVPSLHQGAFPSNNNRMLQKTRLLKFTP